MTAPLGILVLAYGGPEREADVAPFLERVMAPRRPSPVVVERALMRYRAIGGGSPLVANTLDQADALRRLLTGRYADRLRGAELQGRAAPVEAAAGVDAPVDAAVRLAVGFKNWEPDIPRAIDSLADAGCSSAVGVVLASHQSERATGGYAHAVRSAPGASRLRVTFAPSFHLAEGYLEAVADRAREAAGKDLRPDTAALLFTAHSLPLLDGRQDSTYQAHLEETSAAVARRIGWSRWELAFQSRSPRPGVEWMGPDVEEVLAATGREAGAALIVPLGFVSEHLETLYDLDVELTAAAERLGVRIARARTVGDHPAFVTALAESVVYTAAEMGGVDEEARV